MKTILQNPRSYFIAAFVLAFDRAATVFANPTGLQIGSGSATAVQSGSQLNVTTSPLAILNWQTFNIAPGETTSFLQPSANSIVFNSIGGANPSQIFGNLNANGTVILANANGFYFGPNSMVKVGGSFLATTAPLPADIGAGGPWQFSGTPPLASIVNYGQIEVGKAKSLYLIAANVENHGALTAPEGDVELLAGDRVLVSERADGRGLSASLQLPRGSVDNFGQITADAGTIALRANVVNQSGILQADSLVEKNGVIELVAGDSLQLGGSSKILARGDASSAGSAGGNVTLKAEKVFQDATGSSIVVTGGAHGGNGGNVEVSAEEIVSLNSVMDAGARSGFRAGELLFDPLNIVLGGSGNGSVPGDGTISAGGVGTLNLNVNTAFLDKKFSSITLQATRNITLNANTVWNLSESTGLTAGQLRLQAGNDIIFNSGSKIVDANGWGVTLDAGWDFATQGLVSGTGNIYLNGGAGKTLNGAIATSAGGINLNAGNSILVGTGFVRTDGGGSISALAVAGNISTGTLASGSQNSGYDYSFDINGSNPVYPGGYKVTDNLGGISTRAGGDVSLVAGDSINPSTRATSFGVSGAFGSQAGNVTLVAGSLVQGNFNVANGTGKILAGVDLASGTPHIVSDAADAGSTTLPLTLGLIDGAWNVWAAHDIYINEVYNPNGTFNSQVVSVPTGRNYQGNTDGAEVPTQTKFLNNYADDAAVNLWAGNLIDLVGGNLRRLNGYPSTVTLPIYAPVLSLNAGAGGILLERSILLAPSAKGSLNIVTRDGGDLVGAAQDNNLTGIIMSDSGVPKIETFEQGHALVPLHLNDSRPVKLNIAGDIERFSLNVPTFAEIDVAGRTYNFGFLGRNLSPAQTTYIHAGTDITYRGNVTTAPLTEPLPAALLASPADDNVRGKLRYDAAGGLLTYIGIMTLADRDFLLNPSVLVLDATGVPVLDAAGNPKTTPLTLSDVQKAAIEKLFTDSQDASLGDHGLSLAGSGRFEIQAQSIDLGVSGGITVMAPDAALQKVSTAGPLLDVTAAQNLAMTSTKIANESYQGDLNVTVGGTLDVGGQFSTFGDLSAPKGIFTTSGGDVTVVASGDANINGSRIAAYNGGNVSVTSLHGDVNAGNGGSGYVSLNALEPGGADGLNGIAATIPGSGIIATTVFGSHGTLGDITIKAPEGTVNASLGGVLQIAFNDADTKNNFVNVEAGKDINASGSGIIGNNIQLKAGGNIVGLIIGSKSVDINSQHNVDVTAVSGGGVNINASGTVAGTIVGGGDVSVSGDSIEAAVMGGSVSAKGDTSSASLGVPASNVTKDNAQVADNANTVADKKGDDEDDLKKKKSISLARKTSRVTVFLPTLKKISFNEDKNPKS